MKVIYSKSRREVVTVAPGATFKVVGNPFDRSKAIAMYDHNGLRDNIVEGQPEEICNRLLYSLFGWLKLPGSDGFQLDVWLENAEDQENA